MGSVYVLTEWDVFRITYITQRGWRPEWGGGWWRKPGKTRMSWRDQKDVETEDFDLDQAFLEEYDE